MLGLRDTIVVLQLITMLALGIYFWKDGLIRLAIAQACYCVAVVALFSGATAR